MEEEWTCREWNSTYHPCSFPRTGRDCEYTWAEYAEKVDPTYLPVRCALIIWCGVAIVYHAVKVLRTLLDTRFLTNPRLMLACGVRERRRLFVFHGVDYLWIVGFASGVFMLAYGCDLHGWRGDISFRSTRVLREVSAVLTIVYGAFTMQSLVTTSFRAYKPIAKIRDAKVTAIWPAVAVAVFLLLTSAVSVIVSFFGAKGPEGTVYYPAYLYKITVQYLVLAAWACSCFYRIISYRGKFQLALAEHRRDRQLGRIAASTAAEEAAVRSMARVLTSTAVLAGFIVSLALTMSIITVASLGEATESTVYLSPPCGPGDAVWADYPILILAPSVVTYGMIAYDPCFGRGRCFNTWYRIEVEERTGEMSKRNSFEAWTRTSRRAARSSMSDESLKNWIREHAGKGLEIKEWHGTGGIGSETPVEDMA